MSYLLLIIIIIIIIVKQLNVESQSFPITKIISKKLISDTRNISSSFLFLGKKGYLCPSIDNYLFTNLIFIDTNKGYYRNRAITWLHGILKQHDPIVFYKIVIDLNIILNSISLTRNTIYCFEKAIFTRQRGPLYFTKLSLIWLWY